MATKPVAELKPAPAEQAPAPAKQKKLYVKSTVGPMLDFQTNKFINEAGYHENTLWLKSQMAAGKIVEATPGE